MENPIKMDDLRVPSCLETPMFLEEMANSKFQGTHGCSRTLHFNFGLIGPTNETQWTLLGRRCAGTSHEWEPPEKTRGWELGEEVKLTFSPVK